MPPLAATSLRFYMSRMNVALTAIVQQRLSPFPHDTTRVEAFHVVMIAFNGMNTFKGQETGWMPADLARDPRARHRVARMTLAPILQKLGYPMLHGADAWGGSREEAT